MNKNLHLRFFGSSTLRDQHDQFNKQEGYYKNRDGFWEINLQHFLPQTSPDMIWWWMNHLDMADNQQALQLKGKLQINTSGTTCNDAGNVSSSLQLSYKLPFLPMKLSTALVAESLQSLGNDRIYALEFSNKSSRNHLRYTCRAKWQAYDSGSEISIQYNLPGYLPEFFAILLYNYNCSRLQHLDRMIPQLYSRLRLTKPFETNNLHTEKHLAKYNLLMP